jgi:Mg2+ and Co2+ transporter CorA
MDEKSTSLNIAMKAFSSIATIFLPLQVISGIFGMNVQVPGQHIMSLMPFYMVVLSMLLFSSALFVYFKWTKWL